MIKFDDYIALTNFLKSEFCRQWSLPFTGDHKELNKYAHTNLTIHF